MKTLDKILVILASYMFVFSIAMIVIFCIKDAVPDTLITCTLGSGSIEAIVMAWITVAKKKYDKSEVDNDEMVD